jgi:hypothetical protein
LQNQTIFLIFIIVFSSSSRIMGIRGLITFAESNQKCDFFESITLSNTNIVIDGNNLRFYLYNRLKGRNCAFGGEYKLYYDTVTKYFQRYVSVEFFGQFTLYNRDVINGKTDKAAALPKFSDTLTLSQPGGGRLCPPIGLACLKNP